MSIISIDLSIIVEYITIYGCLEMFRSLALLYYKWYNFFCCLQLVIQMCGEYTVFESFKYQNRNSGKKSETTKINPILNIGNTIKI